MDPAGIDAGAAEDAMLWHVLSLTERGMGAVQDILAVLRESDREMMALAERVRALERLAWCDEITGLPNRRGLGDQLAREEARALRYGQPVAVVVLEIDGLQSVGDSQGHAAAEALARAVAAAVSTATRGSDVIARPTGDTFVALLPGADEAGARAFVQRVQRLARRARPAAGVAMPAMLAAGIATRDEAGTLSDALDLAGYRLTLARPSPG